MSTRKPLIAKASTTSIAARIALLLSALVLAAAAVSLARPAVAQNDADAVLTSPDLEELVGPIALYPDDLVAIVLPASTYPLQIVEAARFLEARKATPSLTPDADWDDSVVALLNYPEVVALLNDDLDWTWDLGTAVLNQRADVLDAIQGFRDRAYAAGNLRSDDRQTVTADNGAIAIAPADPEVIYVPYYEPQRVVVYQTVPVFHYYPWGYPVYYYPYPVGYSFSSGFFWGVTTAFSIGWHTHHLNVYHHDHHHHPYYGWRYYEPFYARNVINVNVNVNRRDDVWRPRNRYGNRPIVRGTEGRAYTAGDSRLGHATTGSTYRSRSADRAPAADARVSASRGANRADVPRTRDAAAANARTAPRTATDTPRDYRAGRSAAAPREVQRTPRETPRAVPPSAASGNDGRLPTPTYRGERSNSATASPRTLGRVTPSRPTETPRAMTRSVPRTSAAPGGYSTNREVAGAPSRPPPADSAPRGDGGAYRNGGNYRSDGGAASSGGGRGERQARSNGGQHRSNSR